MIPLAWGGVGYTCYLYGQFARLLGSFSSLSLRLCLDIGAISDLSVLFHSSLAFSNSEWSVLMNILASLKV